MRTAPWLLILCGVAACGPDEVDFVVEYNRLLCTHTLSCGDPATLTFDGELSAEQCESAKLAEVVAWGEGCTYRAGAADACLFAMETLTCPGDGVLAPRPEVCLSVYTDCSAVAPTPDPVDDTDPS